MPFEYILKFGLTCYSFLNFLLDNTKLEYTKWTFHFLTEYLYKRSINKKYPQNI